MRCSLPISRMRSRLPVKLSISFLCTKIACIAVASEAPQNCPGFRGPGATGVLEGYTLPKTWNAAPAVGESEEGLVPQYSGDLENWAIEPWVLETSQDLFSTSSVVRYI